MKQWLIPPWLGEEEQIPTPKSTGHPGLGGDDGEVNLEDTDNAGLHVDDRLNIPNADGRVLVNVGHTENDPDIFLAPQIQRIIKPHQVSTCKAFAFTTYMLNI